VCGKSFNEDLLYLNSFWGTHAYLLSRHGANRLLTAHNKIQVQVDYFIQRNVEVLALKKQICFQKNDCGYTNIQKNPVL